MYQKITLIGNLGRDPEMRYLPSGKAVTNISVATNRRWTDNEGAKHDETTWFRVSVWGAQGEAVNNYLKQGSRVFIEGRLRPDPETGGPKIWTSNEGKPGANFEVTAQSVLFLSKKDDTVVGTAGPSDDPIDEDDIPF